MKKSRFGKENAFSNPLLGAEKDQHHNPPGEKGSGQASLKVQVDEEEVKFLGPDK
jgi:hypothetical protein